MRLRPATELRADVLRILGVERARLSAVVPEGELRLTGATSVPTMLTRGDVDLHLRVPLEAFPATVSALRRLYRVVLPDIWAPSLATFAVDGHPLPTGVAVTPRDSEHDLLFERTWERIAAEPALVAAFNDVKVRSAAAGEAAYERAKSGFFAALVSGEPGRSAASR